MKENDKLNIITILGVLGIGFALIWAISCTNIPVEIKSQFADLILMLTSGLIGFLSRGFSRQSNSEEPPKETP